MKGVVIAFTGMLLLAGWANAQAVLIVADEIPAMNVLANALKTQAGLTSKIVTQTDLPASLSGFRAVVVYIHKDLDSLPERAFIDYAQNGGKLICLHHSISSAKRKNRSWFPFLGVELPKKEVNEGGYAYLGGVTMAVVNLAPGHFITSHEITYDTTIAYTREGQHSGEKLPGFILSNTEAFVNHTLLTPRTILLGVKLTDATGKVWMQDRSAWYMPVGKGQLFYSQPGHAVSDFENPVYTRILANAVIYPYP